MPTGLVISTQVRKSEKIDHFIVTVLFVNSNTASDVLF